MLISNNSQVRKNYFLNNKVLLCGGQGVVRRAILYIDRSCWLACVKVQEKLVADTQHWCPILCSSFLCDGQGAVMEAIQYGGK